MKWYSSLSTLLLKESSEGEERLSELRTKLACQIVNLYKTILEYIMKTICAHHRHTASNAIRNTLRLDDWNGSLDSVNKAEQSVKDVIGQFDARQATTYLGLITNLFMSEGEAKIMGGCCVANMEAEIESLQNRKDQLLADSYKWILETQEYQSFTNWQDSSAKPLLWVKGDPGKGKTMLLIGIVRELTDHVNTHFDQSHLSYFFCQGIDNKLNTVTAIMRGLIWMLLRQERSLIRHLDDKFKSLGLASSRIALPSTVSRQFSS